MLFSTHGTYKIEVADNVITVDGHGPFNEELLTAYNSDINKAIEKVSEKHKKWGQIVYLNDNALLSQEAEKKLEAESRWLNQNMGFRFCAFILVNMQGSQFVQKQYENLLHVSGINTKFCETLEEAEEWLRHKTINMN